MAAPDFQFMSLAVSYQSPGQSFEEVRISDYLNSYRTTGRPPPPCPSVPGDDAARARAGLPPLFKPTLESSLASGSGDAPGTSAPNPQKIIDPAQIPLAQEFKATKADGDNVQSICAMPMYSGFCHEELRIYAYLRGNKVSPTPIIMSPFVLAPRPTTTSTAANAAAPVLSTAFSSTTSNSNPLTSTIRPNNVTSTSNEEQYMTITTQQAFSNHSLEELRVAYLRAGRRELNSAEIRDMERSASTVVVPVAVPQPPQNSLFGTPAARTTQSQSLFAPTASTPTNPFAKRLF